ncbi:MAG TPA: hypothetical protein VIN75_26075 [Burkholderiaceae bacterium]
MAHFSVAPTPAAPKLRGHLRKGENRPAKTGRAARVRAGTFNSVARRADVLRRLAERVNTGRTTTATYLGTLGADEAFIASYASPYGRAVAKVYREKFGAEPERSGLAVRGRHLLRVFAYSADELPILDAAARAYNRTATLVGGAR